MTNEPPIPMSPDELPQQRIHEVTTLPSKPEPFDCTVGYGQFPKGSLPSAIPLTIACIAGSIAEAPYGVPKMVELQAKSYLTWALIDVLDRFKKHSVSDNEGASTL